MTLPSSVGGDITETVGYFDFGAEKLARWVREGLDHSWRCTQPQWEDAAAALAALAPSALLTRRAFVPVDAWTILLTNGPLGTDVGMIPSLAARELGCRAIRAVRTGDDAEYPARILEVFGPDGEPVLAYERSIAAANDGGRWVFETSGTPYPFEDLTAYERRTKSSRFTGEMLLSYLRSLGVPIDREPDWPATWLLELEQ